MQMYLQPQQPQQWNPATSARERLALPPIMIGGASSSSTPRNHASEYNATPVMMMRPPMGHRPMMMSPSGMTVSPAFARPPPPPLQTSCSPAISKKRIRTIPNATKSITLDLLHPHFDRPLAEVAAMFGICMTLMKKICRKNGVPRWPHRQIRGLRKSIWSIEKALRSCDSESQRRSYLDHLDKQNEKLTAILRGPDGPTGSKSLFHELVMSVPCSPMSDLATPRAASTPTAAAAAAAAPVVAAPVTTPVAAQSPAVYRPAFGHSPRIHEATGYPQTPTISRLPSIASLLAAHAKDQRMAMSTHSFQC